MQFFRFDSEVMRTITQFDSRQVGYSPILHSEEPIHVGCLHFAPGSLVGFHPAVGNQLFLVVAGEGWVRTDSTGPCLIKAGQAAFWTDDEGHESGSDTGMTVIVLESPSLDPAKTMEALDELPSLPR
ncbi:MAG: cupin domain-containing protein [Clostridia bacterium]